MWYTYGWWDPWNTQKNTYIKDSGEEITLEHRFIYIPDGVDSQEEVLAKELEEAFEL